MKTKVPGWGKAIGIIMICLGGLGLFYQIYKMIIPSIFRFQREMMENVSNLEVEPNMGQEQVFIKFEEMMHLSAYQESLLLLFGIIGTILCALYLVAGIKLLTVKPINLQLAKGALFIFILFNLVSSLLLILDGFSLVLIGILVYSFIGLLFDVVLIIILFMSDKSAYINEEDHF
jgi:hypothetical protein